MKIGMSSASVESQGQSGSRSSRLGVRVGQKQGKDAWNSYLAKVTIDGSKPTRDFYTSMYHLFIQPNNIADVDGKYTGPNREVSQSPTGKFTPPGRNGISSGPPSALYHPDAGADARLYQLHARLQRTAGTPAHLVAVGTGDLHHDRQPFGTDDCGCLPERITGFDPERAYNEIRDRFKAAITSRTGISTTSMATIHTT